MDLNEAIKHCHEKAEEIRKANEEMPTDCKLSEDLCECAKDHEQLAEWLTELQERREADRWIPVSERLPDKNMPCLVSVGKFNLTQIAMYSDLMETIDHKIFYQGDYGKNNFQNITEYVNAWKPLPEPYEPKEESEAEDLYYQAAVEYTEYCERYEPTYNPDNGSM